MELFHMLTYKFNKLYQYHYDNNHSKQENHHIRKPYIRIFGFLQKFEIEFNEKLFV